MVGIEGVEILHENNEYKLIKEDHELLIVHSDYFTQEAAVLFTVAGDKSDWSERMLIESAKKVVDLLGESKFYPNGME